MNSVNEKNDPTINLEHFYDYYLHRTVSYFIFILTHAQNDPYYTSKYDANLTNVNVKILAGNCASLQYISALS